MNRCVVVVILCCVPALARAQDQKEVATFSIVACDTTGGFLGVGVQSRVVSAGSIVPAAEAGVGAIATQAAANVGYKADALGMLREGRSAEEVRAHFIRSDSGIHRRQFAVADGRCRFAAFTGDSTLAWAGHRVGQHYSVQGNILTGAEVVEAMARAYEDAESRGLPFGQRLLASLKAGQAAGGDRRGRQAAGLLIVKPDAGYGGGDDRYADLRVEDHPEPILELERIYGIWMSLFHPNDHFLPAGSEPFGAPTGPHICTLRNRLARLGFGTASEARSCAFDEEVITALKAFQRAHGLPEQPRLTPEAAAKLNELSRLSSSRFKGSESLKDSISRGTRGVRVVENGHPGSHHEGEAELGRDAPDRSEPLRGLKSIFTAETRHRNRREIFSRDSTYHSLPLSNSLRLCGQCC